MFGQPSYMGYSSGYVPAYYPQPTAATPQMGQAMQMQGLQMMQGQPMQMQNQMMQNPAQMSAMQGSGSSGSGVIWVTDERAALEYPVAPNSAVVLWDINCPVIYKKQADASGKPTTQIYDLVERKSAPNQQQAAQTPHEDYALKSELQNLSARLDAFISQTQSRPKKSGGKEDNVKEAADNG